MIFRTYAVTYSGLSNTPVELLFVSANDLVYSTYRLLALSAIWRCFDSNIYNKIRNINFRPSLRTPHHKIRPLQNLKISILRPILCLDKIRIVPFFQRESLRGGECSSGSSHPLEALQQGGHFHTRSRHFFKSDHRTKTTG